jgi:hypothetical protein
MHTYACLCMHTHTHTCICIHRHVSWRMIGNVTVMGWLADLSPFICRQLAATSVSPYLLHNESLLSGPCVLSQSQLPRKEWGLTGWISDSVPGSSANTTIIWPCSPPVILPTNFGHLIHLQILQTSRAANLHASRKWSTHLDFARCTFHVLDFTSHGQCGLASKRIIIVQVLG